MFDKNITPAEYQDLSTARADVVRQLLVEALQEYVPVGYVLSVDPAKMYGNALLALPSLHPAAGQKMVSFMHAINYRPSVTGGELAYRPTVEFVRAYGHAKGAAHWEQDLLFGAEGRLEITSGAGVNLAAMISFIAAQICLSRHSRRSSGAASSVTTVASGSCSTASAICSRCGRREAGTAPLWAPVRPRWRRPRPKLETAARFTICCEHQERLASLGEQFAQIEVSTEGEEAEVPSM